MSDTRRIVDVDELLKYMKDTRTYDIVWALQYAPIIQTCEDCISRAEVKSVLCNKIIELVEINTINPEDNPKADAMAYGVSWSLNTLMDLPSVTPDRPKGKWTEIEIDAGEFIYKCTECGMRVINPYKYCPNCGSYNGGGEECQNRRLSKKLY